MEGLEEENCPQGNCTSIRGGNIYFMAIGINLYRRRWSRYIRSHFGWWYPWWVRWWYWNVICQLGCNWEVVIFFSRSFFGMSGSIVSGRIRWYGNRTINIHIIINRISQAGLRRIHKRNVIYINIFTTILIIIKRRLIIINIFFVNEVG